jgi:hypothetical protein
VCVPAVPASVLCSAQLRDVRAHAHNSLCALAVLCAVCKTLILLATDAILLTVRKRVVGCVHLRTSGTPFITGSHDGKCSPKYVPCCAVRAVLCSMRWPTRTTV